MLRSIIKIIKSTVRGHLARNPGGAGTHQVHTYTDRRTKRQPDTSGRYFRRTTDKMEHTHATKRRVTQSMKDYRHLKLNTYPPAGVEVEESQGGTNWVLRWRSPKTGKIVQAYPMEFRRAKDAEKFERIRGMRKVLPRLRTQLNEDLDREDAHVRRVLAGVVTLIDRSYFRVGSTTNVDHGVFGVSTLRPHHVEFAGERAMTFSYVGKRQVQQQKIVGDERVAGIIRHLKEQGGEQLFVYRDKSGVVKPLTRHHVNAYLGKYGVTAKDFRTFHASRLAAEKFAELGPPRNAKEMKANIKAVAEYVAQRLGNTPAVAKSSYVMPEIIEAYQRGEIVRSLAKSRALTVGILESERRFFDLLDKIAEGNREGRTDHSAREGVGVASSGG